MRWSIPWGLLVYPIQGGDFGDGYNKQTRHMTPILGKIAYEAYCAKTNWKSLVSGADLPQWGALKPEIKDAWEAAAIAVATEISTVTGRG